MIEISLRFPQETEERYPLVCVTGEIGVEEVHVIDVYRLDDNEARRATEERRTHGFSFTHLEPSDIEIAMETNDGTIQLILSPFDVVRLANALLATVNYRETN
jgi:hypothetical protein